MSASLPDVPLVEQELKSSCVAASARMVLIFLGDARTEEELRALLGTEDGGTKIGHLTRLATWGYEVNFYKAGPAFLEVCLESGFPPIVALETGFLTYWDEACSHAAVLVGIDDEAVRLNDPSFPAAPRSVPLAEFLRAWEANELVCAVILPPARGG